MSITQRYTGTLTIQACPDCGTNFGCEEDLIEARRKDGRTFYCPNGHRLSYKDSEVERLRKETQRLARRAENLEAQRDQLTTSVEHERRRVATYKGHLTRTRNRITSGNCPCCDEHFPDLQSHITTAHPSYKDTDE